MTTHLTYFEDTYKFQDHAIIMAVGTDESGDYLLLNQTLFYPQGGGQPSDQGIIEADGITIPVHKVKCIDNEVRHYTDRGYSHLIGKRGNCSLDRKTRLLHAKLHTSGHLLSNVIETLYPCWKAVKGHHFPGECYVEFISTNEQFDNISLQYINQAIAEWLEKNSLITIDQVSNQKLHEICPALTYTVPIDQPIRIMRIGDFSFSPCGGTHVKSLQELKGLEISKYKVKNNRMKVYYHLGNTECDQ